MTRPVLVASVACLAIAVGVFLGGSERTAPSLPAQSQEAAPISARIEVHVAGWVMSPGVVELAEGSLVVEAIEAAGGLKQGAQSDGINLAAPVHDGEQVLVPGPESSGVEGNPGDELIAVNQADATQLEKLPGVGPVLAERIVSYRDENGPFREVEDLLDVPGIGEAKLGALRDLIRVP